MRFATTGSSWLQVSGIVATAISIFLGGPAGSQAAENPKESEAVESEAPRPPRAPTVPLDRLLRLPSDVDYKVEMRAGLTRSEWRGRFTKRTRERDDAKLSLDATQGELSRLAAKTDAWNLGTPGTTASADAGDPLSFRLDQRIRREKEDLAEAEQKLEALKVEANLAKVPKPWRKPTPRPTPEALASDDW